MEPEPLGMDTTASATWHAKILIETRQPALHTLAAVGRHVAATPGLIAWQTPRPFPPAAFVYPAGEWELEIEVFTAVLAPNTLASTLREAGLRVREVEIEPLAIAAAAPA